MLFWRWSMAANYMISNAERIRMNQWATCFKMWGTWLIWMKREIFTMDLYKLDLKSPLVYWIEMGIYSVTKKHSILPGFLQPLPIFQTFWRIACCWSTWVRWCKLHLSWQCLGLHMTWCMWRHSLGLLDVTCLQGWNSIISENQTHLFFCVLFSLWCGSVFLCDN